MADGDKSSAGYVGWATHGLFAVGTAAALVGVFCFVEATGSASSLPGVNAGACWIASALAYGYLLNALLRR